MIVTFRTLDLNSEKYLGVIGGQHFGVNLRFMHKHRVEVHGSVRNIGSGCGGHFCDKFVDWSILSELFPYPIGETVSGFDNRCSGRIIPSDDSQLFSPQRSLVVGKIICR